MKKVWNKIAQFFKFVHEEMFKFPKYIIIHPLKGWEEFKRYGKGKMSVAIAFVIIAIIVNIMKFQYSGFIVNDVSIKDMNSVAEIFIVVGAITIITVANWSVTTLFDGKGNMKNIFMMICYCLFPYILCNIVGMILSNILTTEEIAIYNLVISLGVVLMVYMFFVGIISIHEYGLGQCLLTILFTIVAALIIIFVGILLFDLFQKVYGFGYQIYQEITLRDMF